MFFFFSFLGIWLGTLRERGLRVGGSTVILLCGPNSHLKLETTSTHFKKDHSTQNSACSNKKTAPRPCVGANLFGNIAPGHNANGKHKAAHQRPSQRPLSQPTIVADWSSGTARSARRIRRLLILPDVPQRGASEPRPVLPGGTKLKTACLNVVRSVRRCKFN